MERGMSPVIRLRLLRLWMGVFMLAAIVGSGPDFSREVLSSVASARADVPDFVGDFSAPPSATPKYNEIANNHLPVSSSDEPTPIPPPGPPPRLFPVNFPAHLVSGFTTPTLPAFSEESRRIRLGDENGRPVIGRVYGGPDSRVVMLPDGSVGWPNAMIYTDEAFRPLAMEELRDELVRGDFKHFRVHETDHYLVFSQGSVEFARDSGVLLESLYEGLRDAFRDRGLDVKEAEFPLIAVIYRTEGDFRDRHAVSLDVQAFYDQISNRIFFFEHRDRELEDSRFAAMRRPQTVAHEGTHQILANNGIQPRLSQWPEWLVEGLAEFCAPATTNKGAWAGFNIVNSSHLATIGDLEDSLAIQGRNARLTRSRIGHAPGRSTVEYLLRRDELLSTDYALAWGLTHYLANRRHEDFLAYLRFMGQKRPLETTSPDMIVREFQAIFGDDLAAVGQQAHRYLGGLKRSETLPHYAVVFEQTIEPGVVRRGTLVSQSPLVIRQWVESMGSSYSARYEWQAQRFTSRSAANAATENWLKSR